MTSSLSFDADDSSLNLKLDRLEARLARITQTIQNLSGPIGAGTATSAQRGQFYGALQESAVLNSAISAIQDSVGQGVAPTMERIYAAGEGVADIMGRPSSAGHVRLSNEGMGLLGDAIASANLSPMAVIRAADRINAGEITSEFRGQSPFQLLQAVMAAGQTQASPSNTTGGGATGGGGAGGGGGGGGGGGTAAAAAAGAPGPNQAIQMIAGGGNFGTPQHNNPFMNQAPTGPNSPWNPQLGQFNQNAYLVNQQVQQAQQQQQDQYMMRRAVGEVALYGAADAISAYSHYQANRIMYGGSGTMEAAQGYAGLAGTIVGGVAAGLLSGGNPWAIAAGAGIGNRTFSAVAEWWAAPQIQREEAGFALGVFGGSYAGRPGLQSYINKYTAPSHLTTDPRALGFGGFVPAFGGDIGPSRFDSINDISNQHFDKIGHPELKGTVQDVGKTFSEISAGLFAGGADPESRVVDTIASFNPFATQVAGMRKIASEERRDIANAPDQRFTGMRKLVAGATEAVVNYWDKARQDYSAVGLAELYTKRISDLVGTKQAPEVGQRMAKIFGTQPETGGNIADILDQYGAEDTSIYLAIHSPDLISSIDPMVLAATSASIRGNRRNQALGSLRARGSGGAAKRALQLQMMDIESLPDGKDSMEYAQARAQFRDAQRTEFDQSNMISFGIPMAHLEGALQRSDYLPFNPTNRFGLEMRSIRYEEEQVGRLKNFMGMRRRAGNLSEREELELTGEIEGLRTQETRSLSTLANGMEDYLPGMNANRPASFARFDSMTLASLRFGRRAPWVRAYGAFNGIAEQQQTDFANSFGAGSIEPFSRMGALDNAHGSSSAMNRAADAMEKAATALQNIAGGRSGSGSRPGEAAGRLNETLSTNAVPPRNTGFN
jgi:hypothetical protein